MQFRNILLCSITIFLYSHCVFAKNISEDLKNTLPAYAIAVESTILNNASTCRKELDTFRRAIDSKNSWSLQILDASGEPKAGFSFKNHYWLGLKSQCRNLNKIDGVEELFKVNYYAAYFENSNNTLVLGICLPDSCSIPELSRILEKIFKDQTLIMNNIYDVKYKLIVVKDLKDDYQYLMTGKAITIIIIIFMTLVMVIIGTAYDVIIYKKICKNNENNERNKKEGIKEGSDMISVIHGLRFISIVWIIIFHVQFFAGDNTVFVVYKNFLHEIASHGSLAVDTFFFISGFLLFYCFYKRENRKPTEFSFGLLFKMIFKRYIRLTPAHMMTVAAIYIYYSHSSRTTQTLRLQNFPEICAKYWWRNLLYINNFFSWNKMCGGWTWYLADDMQFFIIGQTLAICSVIYPKTCAAIWSTLMISTILASGYLSYFYDFTSDTDKFWETRDILYNSPLTRIGPYLIGIAVAYCFIQKNEKCNLKTMIRWIFSILTAVVIFGIPCIEKNIFSVFWMAIYTAFGRSLWGLGIGWIVIACMSGHGGLVNSFLSLKIFVPFSRLSYCAFLLNCIIIAFYLDGDVVVTLDVMVLLPMMSGMILVVFFGSYIFYIMFETPYTSLLRVLMTP